MKLQKLNADDYEIGMKCTVHKSGKLGFSSSAAIKLKLDINKGLNIAINEEDSSDKNLYIIVEQELKPGAFRVNKAGRYYYLNTKGLFDDLGIDYSNTKKTIIYDIVPVTYEGNKIFKLSKREVTK